MYIDETIGKNINYHFSSFPRPPRFLIPHHREISLQLPILQNPNPAEVLSLSSLANSLKQCNNITHAQTRVGQVTQEAKVRLVVALTTNDETKLHLLELNNESWQISLERELPEGHILNVFTSDNTTLLVTPTHCILLD